MANLIPYGTQNTYFADRTNLIPSVQGYSGEVLDGTWARKVAINQIRALGWAGTIVVTPPNIFEVDTTATVFLPLGAYGTIRPPMFYVFPQFGSVVYYKNFYDGNYGFTSAHLEAGETLVRGWDLRTWVDYLTYTATTVNGTSYNQWMCVIRHICKPPVQTGAMWMGASARLFPMMQWPNLIQGMGIVLHWRALGINTSS